MAEAPVDLDNAFTEGANATEGIVNLYHHNLAMQALEKQYGPTVYDPAAAKAAEENYLNSQIDPLKVQSASRENAGDNALVSQFGPSAGANPEQIKGAASDVQMQHDLARQHISQLSASANPDGSLSAAQIAAISGDFSQYGVTDPATQAALAKKLQLPAAQGGGTALLGQISNSLLPWQANATTGSTTYGTDAQGNTIAVSRTKTGAPVINALPQGDVVAPEQKVGIAQQNANTNVTRAGIAQQNANTSARGEDLRANNSVYGQSDNAPPAAGQPSNAALDAVIKAKGIDRAIAESNSDAMSTALANRYEQTKGIVPGGQTAQAPDPLAHLPPKGRQMAISQAQQIANQGTNLRNTNQILDTVMQQISPYTTGAGSTLKDLPGSAQANLRANLATLKAQGLTSWIQSLKNAQGQTGVGRVLQSEANAAMNLYGNMEQDQDAKQLAFHAQLFRRAVNDLYSHSQQAYHAQWGTDPGSALGNPPPAAAPAAGGWGNFQVH